MFSHQTDLYSTQVCKSACIVLAKERHSKGKSALLSLKPETANTLSLMFQIFLEKNYCILYESKRHYQSAQLHSEI